MSEESVAAIVAGILAVIRLVTKFRETDSTEPVAKRAGKAAKRFVG